MSEETTSFNLYLVRETDKARLYRYPTQPASQPDFWIPRSVIVEQTKFPPEEGKLPLCQVKILDWFVRKNGL